MAISIRSYFLLFACIFSFLKEKKKRIPLLSGLGHPFSKETFPITTPKKPPRPMGTPPEEGKSCVFHSFGGVPARRGGFY
jgi:hypothetical protein